jgi:hypothetical protein
MLSLGRHGGKAKDAGFLAFSGVATVEIRQACITASESGLNGSKSRPKLSVGQNFNES